MNLNFKYFSGNISVQVKNAFENYVNHKYSAVGELMNDTHSYVLVYWTKPHNQITGIFITDPTTEAVFDASNLSQFITLSSRQLVPIQEAAFGT